MSQLTSLKEIKLPKYEKGVKYSAWSRSYMSACSQRSRASDALDGKILEEFRTENDVTRKTVLEKENKRAWSDLMSCMPFGRLTDCVGDSVSAEFPEGCAHEAWKNLKVEIIEVTQGELEDLKEEFYSLMNWPVSKNPIKAIRKLEDVRRELKATHKVVKTDDDICDQVLKALPEQYDNVVDILRSKQRNGGVTLSEVKKELGAKYQRIMHNKKKRISRRKKRAEVSDSDSDSEEEKGMHARTSSRAMSNMGWGYQIPNGAYCGVAMSGNGYQHSHFGGTAQLGNNPAPVPHTAFVHNNQIIGQGQNPNNIGAPRSRVFNGVCNYCNQYGHKAVDCPLKPSQGQRRNGFMNAGSNTGGRMTRTPCKLCGQNSHMENRCWENPMNAGLRPPNWNSRLRNGPLTQEQVDQILGNNNNSQGVRPGREVVNNAMSLCGICDGPHNENECPIHLLTDRASRATVRAGNGYDSTDSSEGTVATNTREEIGRLVISTETECEASEWCKGHKTIYSHNDLKCFMVPYEDHKLDNKKRYLEEFGGMANDGQRSSDEEKSSILTIDKGELDTKTALLISKDMMSEEEVIDYVENYIHGLEMRVYHCDENWAFIVEGANKETVHEKCYNALLEWQGVNFNVSSELTEERNSSLNTTWTMEETNEELGTPKFELTFDEDLFWIENGEENEVLIKNMTSIDENTNKDEQNNDKVEGSSLSTIHGAGENQDGFSSDDDPDMPELQERIMQTLSDDSSDDESTLEERSGEGAAPNLIPESEDEINEIGNGAMRTEEQPTLTEEEILLRDFVHMAEDVIDENISRADYDENENRELRMWRMAHELIQRSSPEMMNLLMRTDIPPDLNEDIIIRPEETAYENNSETDTGEMDGFYPYVETVDDGEEVQNGASWDTDESSIERRMMEPGGRTYMSDSDEDSSINSGNTESCSSADEMLNIKEPGSGDSIENDIFKCEDMNITEAQEASMIADQMVWINCKPRKWYYNKYIGKRNGELNLYGVTEWKMFSQYMVQLLKLISLISVIKLWTTSQTLMENQNWSKIC